MDIAFEKFDPAKVYRGLSSAGKPGGFKCGLPAIDRFVANGLREQVKKGYSVAWVITDETPVGAKQPVLDEAAPADQKKPSSVEPPPFFVGFYTLLMAQIEKGALASVSDGSMPTQIPCTRLVMLGVDENYKGRGFGSQLMKHALRQTKLACDNIGCRGMYLDADPGALAFYQALGFQQLSTTLKDGSYPMFLFKESFPV